MGHRVVLASLLLCICAYGQASGPGGTKYDQNFKLGSDALAKHDTKGAAQFFELCARDAHARKDARAEAKAWAKLAQADRAESRYETALSADRTALELRQNFKDQAEIAQSLSSVGVDYTSLGQFDKALDCDGKALRMREKIGNPSDIAESLTNIGDDYTSLGQFDKALDCDRKVLAVREKIGNRADIAQSLNNVGFDYRTLGQFDKSLDVDKKALAMRKKIGSPAEVAESLNSVGVDYIFLGQFDKGAECHQKALAMREKIGNPADVAQSLNSVGADYGFLGQFAKALDCDSKALAMREKIGNLADVAQSLNNVGFDYTHLGQFDKALDCDSKALAMREKIGNPADVAQSLNNVGVDYSFLGQFDKAAEYRQKALAMREKIGNPAEVAQSLNSVGAIFSSLGQLDKALEYQQKALAMREKIGNPADVAQSLNSVGNDYRFLGQFDKALEYDQKALAMREKTGNPADIAESLNNVGVDYGSLGQFDQDLDCHSKALAMFEKIGNPSDIAESLDNVGLVYAALGRLDEADHHYARAVRLYEDLGREVGSPSELGAFQAGNVGSLYARFAELRLKEGRQRDALEMSDRGRGQGLAKQIALNAEDAGAILGKDDAKSLGEGRAAYDQAVAKLRALNEKLERAESSSQKTALGAEIETSKAEVEDAEMKYDLTRDALFDKHPDFKLIQGASGSTGERMIQLCANVPDTMFIEFALSDTKLLTFAIAGGGGLKTFQSTVTTSTLKTDVEAYLATLRSSNKEEERLAKKLYENILGPEEPLLNDPNIKRVCFVADGPLLDLPFAALMDRNGTRLIQRFAISSAPSLGCLSWPETGRRPTQPLLVIADPTGEGADRVVSLDRGGFGSLPFARKEGKQVAAEVPGAVALYGGAATESAVKKELPSYALLHFACHGYLDGANAMHSALVMADDTQGQGYLTTEDIMGIRLSAKLAVLSACHTGEGLQSGGEGLMGLTWAFRAAGVPAIVASKWEVDDKATARIMVSFYHQLLVGARKDDALRGAMLEEMKLDESGSASRSISVSGEPATSKPSPVYYWAAFQLIGDASPLKLPLVDKRP